MPDILEHYYRDLVEAANPLGTTLELWVESRAHAALFLKTCAQGIDLEDFPQDPDLGEDLLVSSKLGSLWACCRARLTDSLSAMEALVRITLDTVFEFIEDFPAERRGLLVARAVRVVERLGALHTRAAAFSYDAYLLRQIEEANAEDRQRLARDIHDQLACALILAFRNLELYRMKAAPGTLTGERHLAAIQQSLEDATEFTRNLISGLRAEVPLSSLAETLTDCADRLNFRGLPVQIAVDGDESWLPEHHRAELFLVLREFLRNSFAHAEPRSITMRVSISPRRVDVEALDDGIGFDIEAVNRAMSPASGRPSSTGLSVMRERTQQLGGQLHLTSALRGGTRMRLWVPLPKRGQPSPPRDGLATEPVFGAGTSSLTRARHGT